MPAISEPLAAPQVLAYNFPSRADNKTSRKSEAQMTSLQSPTRAILFPIPYSQFPAFSPFFLPKNRSTPPPLCRGIQFSSPSHFITFMKSIAYILAVLTNQRFQCRFPSLLGPQKPVLSGKSNHFPTLSMPDRAPSNCRFQAKSERERVPAAQRPPRNVQRPSRRMAAVCCFERKASYRSLFRHWIRSPRVVVELETGALWLSFL